MKHTSTYRQKGQAMVMLLVFMIVAVVMTTMAVSLVIVNAQAASRVEQGDMALKLAESGIENALIRLERDPSYTGTETLNLGTGNIISTVSGSNPITIVSTGTQGTFARTVSAVASYNNTILTVSSWKEIN